MQLILKKFNNWLKSETTINLYWSTYQLFLKLCTKPQNVLTLEWIKKCYKIGSIFAIGLLKIIPQKAYSLLALKL